ncbi:MAG: extracellular solute-binding protein [Chloroflexi bacterium]|nr:extracellular solute-binding protein [Chloroflexota bacterium]
MSKQFWSFLFVTLFMLTGCGLLADDPPLFTVTPTLLIPSPVGTPIVPTPELGTSTPVVAATPTRIVLRLWTTEEISPRSEVRGGAVLVEQLDVFASSHPDLLLDVQLKAVSGQGGTLSYLRTGRTVAPSILPDVVLLQASQLAAATQEGLIYPLDGLIPAEMVNDLYPAAANLSRVNNALMGYPFTITGLEHLAYNGGVITRTLPITWNAMINLPNADFVFPAAGMSGSRLILQLYLAFGGTLTNEVNQPNLQVEPLTQALSLISQGRQAGFILLESDNFTTNSEAWQLYQSGLANIVSTSPRNFLDNREFVPGSQYALLAGPNGPLVPLVDAWVWAVTTPDPARQALAVELINWLCSDATMGSWTAVGAQLPARRSAFVFWTVETPYQSFLQTQLELAQPYPAAATSSVITALNNATFAVIDGSKPPEVAAQDAVMAVISSQ